MEYTIGSIADLISGKNTPNKPKVQKLTLEQPNQYVSEITSQTHPPKHQKNPEFKTSKKKKKHKLTSSAGETNMIVINPEMFLKDTDIQDDVQPTKSKKRKRVYNEVVDTNTDEEDADVIKQKKKKKVKVDNDELDCRTIFVGNVPVTVKKRQLLRLFTKYGHVESVRIRCIAPAEPGIPKRVASIKKLMHPKRQTMHSYVRFTLREDAVKALAANGMTYKDHHLRVQISNDVVKPDPRKAIFLGNLPFDVEDEELWSAFESCGTIVSVRVIRDANTNMGIGIAYVNFESSDAVELALQMEDVTVKTNIIRIHRYSRKNKHGQRHQKGEHNKIESKTKKGYKRPKNYPGSASSSRENETKTKNTTVESSVFQGAKSNIKKKKPKLNKGIANKLKLTKKIAPK